MISYLVEQELSNRMPDREVATLLTRVQVDPEDPAFDEPTKPIGAAYSKEKADELRRTRGWTMAREGDREDATAILGGRAGTRIRPG